MRCESCGGDISEYEDSTLCVWCDPDEEEGVEWDIDSIAVLREHAELMYGEKKAPHLAFWVVENTLLYSDTDRQEIMDQIINAHHAVYGTK